MRQIVVASTICRLNKIDDSGCFRRDLLTPEAEPEEHTKMLIRLSFKSLQEIGYAVSEPTL